MWGPRMLKVRYKVNIDDVMKYSESYIVKKPFDRKCEWKSDFTVKARSQKWRIQLYLTLYLYSRKKAERIVNLSLLLNIAFIC